MPLTLHSRASFTPQPVAAPPPSGSPNSSPTIISFTPTTGPSGTTVVIRLSGMPVGFTLTAIRINNVPLINLVKTSDGLIQGDTDGSTTTGQVRVTYNASFNILSQGLVPPIFTAT